MLIDALTYIAAHRDHVRWTQDGVEFTVTHLTKTRSAKHPGPPRKVCYASFPDNNEACPVTVLHLYIQATTRQVSNLRGLNPYSLPPRNQSAEQSPAHWSLD